MYSHVPSHWRIDHDSGRLSDAPWPGVPPTAPRPKQQAQAAGAGRAGAAPRASEATHVHPRSLPCWDQQQTRPSDAGTTGSTCVCIYVCIYVCMYVYIHIFQHVIKAICSGRDQVYCHRPHTPTKLAWTYDGPYLITSSPRGCVMGN
jgi:hypothetical protein